MLTLAVRAHVALLLACSATGRAGSTVRPSRTHPADADRDAGQTTAEYALVLLGAAGIALLLVAWATKSGAIGRLFDLVLDGVMDRVG